MRHLAYLVLWLYAMAVPIENLLVFPGGYSLPRVVGYAGLITALLAIVADGTAKRLGHIQIAALILFAWILFRNLCTTETEHTWFMTFLYAQLIVGVLMVWELADDEKGVQGILQAYLLGTLIAAAMTIAAFLYGLHDKEGRYAADVQDRNELALILALGIPIAWYLASVSRNVLWAWAYRISLPILYSGIFLTGSRGGFLATIVASLAVPVIELHRSGLRKTIIITLAVMITAAMIGKDALPSSIVERLLGTGGELKSGTLTGRRTIWANGLRMFDSHPILGVGPGTFAEQSDRGLVMHNAYLSILVEQGILGCVVWAGVLVCLLSAVRKMPPLERKFWMVLLLTMGVGIGGMSWEYKKTLWLILGMAAAHASVLQQRRQLIHLGERAESRIIDIEVSGESLLPGLQGTHSDS